MSENTNPPAPDASKRLNAPPPSGAPLNVPPPPSSLPVNDAPKAAKPEVAPVISISNSIPASTDNAGLKGFVEKRFKGIALTLSILTFFLNVLPFIGVLFAGYALFFSIRGAQKEQGKKKMLVWAIVLSSLGLLSSLGMTISFLEFLNK